MAVSACALCCGGAHLRLRRQQGTRWLRTEAVRETDSACLHRDYDTTTPPCNAFSSMSLLLVHAHFDRARKLA